MSGAIGQALYRSFQQESAFGDIAQVRVLHPAHLLDKIFYPARFVSNSGSLAMLAAMRLASSFVSNFAADRRPGSFS
jgi:hypothetical protein